MNFPCPAALAITQLFALSLPFALLAKAKAKSILECVEKQLLTPFGLRTLEPDSSSYRPYYGGGPGERDSAYHQGTVWPWLLGHYLIAYLNVWGKDDKSRLYVNEKLESLFSHLGRAGLGHISEVFDAEEPYNPRGCFAQAWPVATLLELLDELAN